MPSSDPARPRRPRRRQCAHHQETKHDVPRIGREPGEPKRRLHAADGMVNVGDADSELRGGHEDHHPRAQSRRPVARTKRNHQRGRMPPTSWRQRQHDRPQRLLRIRRRRGYQRDFAPHAVATDGQRVRLAWRLAIEERRRAVLLNPLVAVPRDHDIAGLQEAARRARRHSTNHRLAGDHLQRKSELLSLARVRHQHEEYKRRQRDESYRRGEHRQPGSRQAAITVASRSTPAAVY